MDYDVIIVGSGFAGAVFAERLANIKNKKVLIIEKRNHIAGNMFDYTNHMGLLIHKYGPHLFHTNNDQVVDYLSQFTDWYPYQHRVLAHVDNQLVPVPFNLTSLERLLPNSSSSLKKKLIDFYGIDVKVPISKLKLQDDPELRKLGEFIFNKIYLNYTVKQWGEKPENLNFEAIAQRVPVHVSYDDRYFQDKFQALPLNGYTKMFENMLASPNITVLLNTQAKDRLSFDLSKKEILFDSEAFDGEVIYTGPIDEIFDYCHGELPYRSLLFETIDCNMNYFQETGTINYPNEHDFTRITEYKHFNKCKDAEGTTIMREYPQAYDRTDLKKNVPYYPIPKEDNDRIYNAYFEKCMQFKQLILVGRLAEYRYYDMHHIIERSLNLFDEKFEKSLIL